MIPLPPRTTTFLSSFALAPALLCLFACAPESMELAQEPPSPTPQPFVSSYVPLVRERFQKVLDGKPVDLYTIRNARGSFAKITNYGAKLEQLVVPDRDGKFGDVVLGYDSIDAAVTGQASMGAFMGRYANRIAGGKFTLDGVQYQLPLNDGARPNTVHGGPKGARFRVFDATQIDTSHLVLRYVFADGEEGFPGTLALTIHYLFTNDDELRVSYEATATDKKTVLNLTSHPFFNLSNNPGTSALDHELTIQADRVLEIDNNLTPTGLLRDVAGTPMDFRNPKTLGKDLGASYDLLVLGSGYDHTYVLNKTADGRLALCARVREPSSGRTLEVWSTEPGLQLFSGNGFAAMSPRDLGKGGVLYPLRSGFALEPMHFPDSPNRPAFPSTVLAPGETYQGEIRYKFSTQP